MASLLGTSGNEVLSGTGSADSISDGAGDDYVAARAGNDTITGGTGNDWYEAGAGADTLVLSSGFGNDIVDLFTNSGGPPYSDNLQFTNINYEDLFSYETGDQYAVTTYTGTDNLTLLDFNSVSPAPFGTFSAPLQAGGTHVDTPTSDDNGNGIADVLETPIASFGTSGSDNIYAGNIGNHQFVAWGGGGGDSLTGSSNASMLFGGGGNDNLTSESTTNFSWLVGGTGDDTYIDDTGLAFVLENGNSTNDSFFSASFAPATNPSALFVETIDNRHLFVANVNTGTEVVFLDWQNPANQIEHFNLWDGSYTYAQIAGFVAGAPNVSWETWSGGAITTADANAQIADMTALAGDDQGPTLNLTIGGTSANETLTGFSGDNTLVGDTGSDMLRGMAGNDIYVFRPGDGNDTVDNVTGATIGETNTLRFGADVLASDLTFTQSGSDLLLTYGSGDSVRLAGWFGANAVLARQVNIGTSDLAVMPLLDASATGTAADEFIVGTGANDTLNGGGGNDRLQGGGGNDTLNGGTGDDTYVFNAGDGSDTIVDTGGNDVIEYHGSTAGWTFARNGNDLFINAGGSITISGQYAGQTVETLTTDSNGTYALRADLTGDGGQDIIVSDAASDTLTGNGGNDVLVGGGGNDTLLGGAGDDLYVYSLGDGNDTITDTGGANDRIDYHGSTANWRFTRSGNDLVLGFDSSNSIIVAGQFSGQTVETLSTDSEGTFTLDTGLTAGTGQNILVGTAGNDTLVANTGNNYFFGGAGDDTLDGGNGNDTYVYYTGDGNDTIEEIGGSNDRFVYHGAVTGWSFIRSGYDLIFNTPDGATITFRNQFLSDVDSLVTDSAGTWSLKPTYTGTSGQDVIVGDVTAETLSGGGGTDYIDGGAGNDTITGGTGNDTLLGGLGDDSYVYNPGDGSDTITDIGGSNDTIIYNGSLGTLSFSRSGDDMLISAGGATIMTVVGQFAGNAIEHITTSEGTRDLLTDPAGGAGLVALNLTKNGGSGDDVLNGGDGNDTLTGNLGNDTLNGGYGNDTYNYTPGDGSDTIVDTGGTDVIAFHGSTAFWGFRRSGNDLIFEPDALSAITIVGQFAGQPIETIATDSYGTYKLRSGLTGDSGQDVIIGTSADETLTGNGGDDFFDGAGGNDTLLGGNGNDTYVLAPGGGADTISDSGGTSDRIVYHDAAGLADARRVGNDLVLTASDGSSVTITNHFNGQPVELLVNAQNNFYTLNTGLTGGSHADILSGTDGAETLTVTSNYNDILFGNGGNDTLQGSGGNDRLVGGTGNDSLFGGGGNDTYEYAPGDGHDVITDGNGQNDSIHYLGAIDALSFSRSGQNLIVSENGMAIITVNSQYGSGGVDSLTADTGGTFQMSAGLTGAGGADILVGTTGADAIAGNGNNDRLFGDSGDDTLTGGAGNDMLSGGTGLDTAVYLGPRSSYSIARNGTTTTVTDLDGAANGGDDGVDTLTSVERLQFSDTTVSLATARNDFNGDGSSDLFWQNANGSLAQWQQDGTAYVGGGVFAGAPSDWSIAAEADFTGDGKADILWQNTNGSLAEWQMDGTNYIGGGVIAGPPAGWSLAAVADFNGDGKADLLWQNTNGSLAEWQMDGTSYIGGGVFSGPPAGWTLAAEADFNGDGKTDLLWQNANGALAEWQMDGTNYIGGGVFSGAPAGWTLKGVADFTGDGKADLLWQNGNALGEWYMDGTNYIGGGVFSAAAGTWSIAGLSDFNGDGKTDILWSDASGNLAQWQMDGTSYVGGGVFGPKPAGWNLVNTGQLIA